MRRVLAPLGGAISFIIVALLVVGGLTWVTIESLHVESERRQATARAQAAQNERLALWRLDSRLFPAWGVENNRPYAQYFAFAMCPVVLENEEPQRIPSPLIQCELPDWMRLHFQLDPETGWDSPQVKADGQWSRAPELVELFNQLTPATVNDDRYSVLSELRSKFPAKAMHEQLLSLETNLDDSPLSIPTIPYRFNEPGVQSMPPALGNQFGALQQGRLESRGVLADGTPADVLRKQVEEKQDGTGEATRGLIGGGYGGGGNGTESASKNPSPPLPTPQPPGAAMPPGAAIPPATAPATPTAPVTQNVQGNVAQTNRGGTTGQPNPPPGGRDDRAKSFKGASDEIRNPGPAGGGGGGNAQPGDPAKNAPAKPEEVNKEKKDDAAGKKEAESSPAPTAKPAEPPPAPKAPPIMGRGRGAPGDEKPSDEKSVAPAKEAEKLRDKDGADRPAAPKPEAKKPNYQVIRPPSVQLGPMRPIWLKSPGGDEALVLVRVAKLETKTVFQGVLLNWSRLQQVLTEEVRPQFPDAKLEPVRDVIAPTERCMTALPALLDPGPEPSPPPAGWTPLRIGLLLGWIAALLALAAVGFVGWTLIDLSERRIRFVSAVTHELRTPLTSLRLSTDLLSSGMIADEDQQRQYLKTMGHESERLNTLIENVLDFAKLEKRTVRAHCVPLPLGDLLDQVKQTWSERLAAEGRELVVVSTLPPEQTLNTDARMAAQILGNLIDNARKYSREAEEKRIWLWARPGEHNRVILEVEDRGPGVAPGECGSIFRPFRRGQNVSATGGAGLGLALAKQWADLLGGTLAYRPADGGIGACFRLELPAS